MPLRIGTHILVRRVVVSRMSIVIQGMKMPKDRAVIEIHPVGGYACTRYGFVVGRVIEIPPHGRLIDADALNLDYEVEMADDWKTAHEIANVVKYAPTIIPADPEGGANDG